MIIQIYEIQTPQEAEALIQLGVDHIGSVILDRNNWQNPEIREAVRLTEGTKSRSSLIPLFRDLEGILQILDYYQPDIVHFCENIPLTYGDGVPLIRVTDELRQIQEVVKHRFPTVQIIRSIPIPAAITHPIDASIRKQINHDAIQKSHSVTDAGDDPEQTSLRNAIAIMVKIFTPVTDFFMTDTVLGMYSGDKSGGGALQPVAGFVGITGMVCDWEIANWLTKISPLPVILAGGLGFENVFTALCKVQPAGVDSCTRTNAMDSQGRPIRFQKDFTKVRRFTEEVRRAETLFSQ